MFDLYIVDTHALLWHLDGSPLLGDQARQVLDDPDARLILPAIALAEALFVLEKKASQFSIDENALLEKIGTDSRLEFTALDQKTIQASLDCKAIPEIHDRQIVATAVLLQSEDVEVAILTRDNNIRNVDLVPTVW